MVLVLMGLLILVDLDGGAAASDTIHRNKYGGSGAGSGGAGGGGAGHALFSGVSMKYRYYGAGGGAGNPGGSGSQTGNGGSSGTGGLLILYSDTLENYGSIQSLGSSRWIG